MCITVCSQSHQGRATDSEKAREEIESEDAEKERREEDDPELLQRARDMDEYKDGTKERFVYQFFAGENQITLLGVKTAMLYL